MIPQAVDHKQMFYKPGISVTSINAYYESPAHFWQTSSYNPQKIRKPATDAMTFGRIVHNLILTPEAYEAEFVVEPQKKDHPGAVDTNDEIKEALRAAGATLGGNKDEMLKRLRTVAPLVPIWSDVVADAHKAAGKRTVITQEQYDNAARLRDAMFENKAVKQLIGNGASEAPVTWYREDGPLMCKCKLDYLRTGLLIEYKTSDSAHPDDVAKTMVNFGYHRQMAWEMDAATTLYGEKPRGAIIIFQDKALPEAIGIYALNAHDLAVGAAENTAAYQAICERMKTKNWQAFPERIVPISLPRWYNSPVID